MCKYCKYGVNTTIVVITTPLSNVNVNKYAM